MAILPMPAAKSSTNAPRLRSASDADQAEVRALLEASGLPTADLATSRPEFIVACQDGRIIATGALQRCGTSGSALLRSVAVAADTRGRGLGRSIVRELERIARSEGISQLTLLTQDARAFFATLGYQVIERQAAPKEVQQSAEFRSLCPSSCVCLSKGLDMYDADSPA
ncbi:MAG TPA: arsenic resistance N-acetyltransferase ArsN2 [Steroidobacteraceae bacterium]